MKPVPVEWGLLVDQYRLGLGYLPLVTDDLSDIRNSRALIPDEYDFGKSKKRHGGILNIAGGIRRPDQPMTDCAAQA